MSGEAGGLAGVRIEHFEHERFVSLHLGKIVPEMRGVVGDMIDLAGAIRIPSLHKNKPLRWYAARITDRERIHDHFAPDRTPYLDDGIAPLEPRVRLAVTNDLPQPSGRRILGVIVMHGLYGRASRFGGARRLVASANRVIEHDNR